MLQKNPSQNLNLFSNIVHFKMSTNHQKYLLNPPEISLEMHSLIGSWPDLLSLTYICKTKGLDLTDICIEDYCLCNQGLISLGSFHRLREPKRGVPSPGGWMGCGQAYTAHVLIKIANAVSRILQAI